MPDDPIGIDLARRIYDFGLTADDLGPRQYGTAALSKGTAVLSAGYDRRTWTRATSPPKALPNALS